MRAHTTFSHTELPAIDGTLRVEFYVDDDTVTDQDVLEEIQTKSPYRQHRLIDLNELRQGVWMAVFTYT